MHSLVSEVMAQSPEIAGEFVFVPRIGVGMQLGGWVMGTDCEWPCESTTWSRGGPWHSCSTDQLDDG